MRDTPPSLARRPRLNTTPLAGGSLALWRGSARTLPISAFDAHPDELADILRRQGYHVTAPTTTNTTEPNR